MGDGLKAWPDCYDATQFVHFGGAVGGREITGLLKLSLLCISASGWC